jgi:hypothetical protein
MSSTFSMTSPADILRQAAAAVPLRIAHSALITHVVCIEGCLVEVDEEAIRVRPSNPRPDRLFGDPASTRDR